MTEPCKHKLAMVPASRYAKTGHKNLYPYGAIICYICGDTRPAKEGETDKYKDILDVFSKADGVNYWNEGQGRTSPKPKLKRGEKFNLLTVVRYTGRKRYGKREIVCRCDCGNLTTTTDSQVRNGKTKSCGCLRKGRTK